MDVEQLEVSFFILKYVLSVLILAAMVEHIPTDRRRLLMISASSPSPRTSIVQVSLPQIVAVSTPMTLCD